MKELEEKINKYGKILPGNVLKIDNFINHQIDTKLLDQMGKAFYDAFKNDNITKIITIEASGIAFAVAAAYYFDHCPVVYAKKNAGSNTSKDVYVSKAFSYTKQKEFDVIIDKNYISSDDNVLIIDDFLANGQAVKALIDIVKMAGGKVSGCGFVVTKAHQDGEKMLKEMGIKTLSLARIISMNEEEGVIFG